MSNIDDISLLEDDQSPPQIKARQQSRNANLGHNVSSSEAQRSREDALRQELASVKNVNEAIEGVLASLEKAKANMKTVNSTTEHNQRLILDPTWQGASQDIADIEEEAQAKQEAAERREIEEQERKAAAARKAEEDERRRAEAAARATKTTSRARGRGGSISRGSTLASSSSTPATTSSNSSLLRAPSTSRRGTSGIGRGRNPRGKT